jgi:alpha-tubulin suppressor-like RCC1 family protein
MALSGGWGRNLSGELGDSTTLDRSSPIQIGSRTNWVDMIYGADNLHSAAINTLGELWVWGGGASGRLGDGTTLNKSSPVQVGAMTDWASICGGDEHVLALKTNGTLWAWGNNNFGALGGASNNRSSPVQVGALTTWSKVAASRSSSSAIRTDGTLWVWGNGEFGRLGVGSLNNFSSPVMVGTATNWVQVSQGFQFQTVLNSSGEIWNCGANSQGELARDTGGNDRSAPTQVGALTTWQKLALGGLFNAAIRTDGTLWAWGYNDQGQIGVSSSFLAFISPVQVGTMTDWSQVACRYDSMSAVKTGGTLWSWGDSSSGELGTNDLVDRNSPVQVGAMSDWVNVFAGPLADCVLALKSNNSLWGWGHSATDCFGEGSATNRSSPVQVGVGESWQFVSAAGGVIGRYYSLALTTTGALFGAGDNTYAQTLSTSVTWRTSSPIQVGAMTDWAQVTTADRSSAALKTNGTMWVWGEGGGGTLANQDTKGSISPIQVGAMTDWSKINSGCSFTMAIKTNGTLWTWGLNLGGRLGTSSSTISQSSPVQIGALSGWTDVGPGEIHTMAIRQGALWAWGDHLFGRLGNGAATGVSNSPIQIGSMTDWMMVRSNRTGGHSLAIKTDGTLWAWGESNAGGNLGDGTSSNRSSPVQIGNNRNWSDIACGDNSCIAKKNTS